MKEEVIELEGVADVAKDITHRMKNTGIRGINVDVATELGVFERIANLLSATHSTILAAYIIYGWVDYIFSDLGARKNEIAQEMNNFEKAVKKHLGFWSSFYNNKHKDTNDVGFQAERLATMIMRWMELPETWEVGGEQRTHPDISTAIRIHLQDDVYTVHRSSTDKSVEITEETWAVLKFDPATNKQNSIHTNMDKASAMMVAKRLSAEDTESIYTVGLVQGIVEKRLDVTPVKAFKNNETIGKITKQFNE